MIRPQVKSLSNEDFGGFDLRSLPNRLQAGALLATDLDTSISNSNPRQTNQINLLYIEGSSLKLTQQIMGYNEIWIFLGKLS